ncbi:MAG: hypothetical protein ACREQ9_22400, partial [Candidatus Binatia bacterium]
LTLYALLEVRPGARHLDPPLPDRRREIPSTRAIAPRQDFVPHRNRYRYAAEQPAQHRDRSPGEELRRVSARKSTRVDFSTTGFAGVFTMIEENLAVLFETEVLGSRVTVERVDLDRDERVVAICRRGRERQSLPILDLPLPAPAPRGAAWIEAYRRWRGEG